MKVKIWNRKEEKHEESVKRETETVGSIYKQSFPHMAYSSTLMMKERFFCNISSLEYDN
jgi:hypothetical protein